MRDKFNRDQEISAAAKTAASRCCDRRRSCRNDAASDLLRKGFGVTLLEPDSRLGGSLWEVPRAVLPEEVLLAECARLADAKVDVRLDQRIDVRPV